MARLVSPKFCELGTYTFRVPLHLPLPHFKKVGQTAIAKKDRLMVRKLKGKYDYHQVKVNFTPDDFEKLELLAIEHNMTKAHLLRTCIGYKLENVRKPVAINPPVKEIKVDSNWRYEVNKIGVNLNQAVEAMHTSKSVIELKALSYIIQQLDTLDSRVTEYIMNKDKEK